MRILICTLSVIATIVCVPVNSTQDSEDESKDLKEALAQLTSILEHFAHVTTPAPINPDLPPCDYGWIRYRNSCYWYGQVKLPIDSAEFDCRNRQAELFEVNEPDEFETILESAPLDTYIWVGPRTETDPYEPSDNPNEPFQKQISKEVYNKVIKYATIGWTEFSKCPAFISPTLRPFKKHTRYFNCGLPFQYICERDLNPFDPLNDPHAFG